MATTVAEMNVDYPVLSYKYEVSFDDAEWGGKEGNAAAFSEVSGLSIEYESVVYEDGVNGRRQLPGKIALVSLSIKRGIVRQRDALFQWINSSHTADFKKRNMVIVLKDLEDKPVATWNVMGAFPKKLDAPSFNAGSNEVAIESLDLTADRLSITYEE